VPRLVAGGELAGDAVPAVLEQLPVARPPALERVDAIVHQADVAGGTGDDAAAAAVASVTMRTALSFNLSLHKEGLLRRGGSG